MAAALPGPSPRCGLAFELAEVPGVATAGLLLRGGKPKEALSSSRARHPHPGFFPGVFPTWPHGPAQAPAAAQPGSGRTGQKQQPQASQQQQTPANSPAAALQRSLPGSLDAPERLRDAVLPPVAPTNLAQPSLVVRIGSMLQPQGETLCDRTLGERVINVLTSLPFSAVGLHMLRQRRTRQGRRHGGSLVAVGAMAALYHASFGRFRGLARKLDYWTISWSAVEMTKALHLGNAWARRAATASLLAVPFRPFLVSSAHATLLEYEFIRQARTNKSLRRDLALHASTAAVGTAAFFLEDVMKESTGFELMHPIWHCLSAYGVATMNGLLAHNEREHLRRQKKGGLHTPHCSATSLMDLQQRSSFDSGKSFSSK